MNLLFLCVFMRSGIAGDDLAIALGGDDYRWQVEWLTKSGDYGPGDYGRKLQLQGLTRFYQFRVPAGYIKDKPCPVVLVFHGGGGYPGAVRYQTDFDKLAEKEGFIAVFPAGHHSVFHDRLLYWNDGRTAKRDRKFSQIDDVAYVNAILDDLSQFFNIDQNRIYATGISNGGAMCFRLAAELSNRIAAIAPVVFQREIGEYGQRPPCPIPLIMFNGKKDVYAKFYGGKPPHSFFKEALKPVIPSLQSWVAHNGCSTEPVKTETRGNAVITYYGGCKEGSEIVSVVLEDGGHTWPGGKMVVSEVSMKTGPVNHDISSVVMIWDFFKRHVKE
jgi:polyhydroxybutyrate depolymerase